MYIASKILVKYPTTEVWYVKTFKNSIQTIYVKYKVVSTKTNVSADTITENIQFKLKKPTY